MIFVTRRDRLVMVAESLLNCKEFLHGTPVVNCISSVLQLHMRLVIDLVKQGKSFESTNFLSVTFDILIDKHLCYFVLQGTIRS